LLKSMRQQCSVRYPGVKSGRHCKQEWTQRVDRQKATVVNVKRIMAKVQYQIQLRRMESSSA
jgi:hypothetical protein